MKIFKYCLFVISFAFSSVCWSQDFAPVQDLVRRRFPAMYGKVKITAFSVMGHDSASYFSRQGRLYITANTVNAASYALYDYVKKYCHSSLSHTGDNIRIPADLPPTKNKENISAVYPLRYALNYCTYNYTMAFWRWEDWERELDWMSLNGVNIMLAQMGTELVWQRTLEQLGVSNADIRSFIPGPAFNAWWLMGNLEGWGGPVSDRMIQHWSDLQSKILNRMRELGIKPVVQGFTGLVPSTLKKYFPDAQIIDQGQWWGFTRPSVLLPTDSLFGKISELYYKNWEALYGGDISYLGGDLFHEGGKTQGVNLTETARLIQKDMLQHFPHAVWVLQGWQSNPKQQILDGLDPRHTLIIDLLGDDHQTWLQRNQYGGFPWIWTTITNFGAKTTSSGTLLRAYTETKKAEKIFGKNLLLQGTGIIPEGIENNAIVYQWALDRSWQRQMPDLDTNLDEFITARYGVPNAHLKTAWHCLLQTIYSGYNPSVTGGQGGFESIFCARPDVNIRTTSCCGPTRLWYDMDVLRQAAEELALGASEVNPSEGLDYDLVDTWRQVINLHGRVAYDSIMWAIQNPAISPSEKRIIFERNKKCFLTLLKLQDQWLGTNKMFRLGRWTSQAFSMLQDSADQRLAIWNAKVQITYWSKTGSLHEYANKEWQGLLSDLYLPRWEKFFAYLSAKLEGKEANAPDFFSMEKEWCLKQDSYNAEPTGDQKTILQKIQSCLSTK